MVKFAVVEEPVSPSLEYRNFQRGFQAKGADLRFAQGRHIACIDTRLKCIYGA